jgi:hypothetical protein
MKNADYRRLLADRIQKLCLGNGVLTPSSALERWNKRSSVVEKAVDAESARWGDYRRDVHRWQTAGPFAVYTRDDHWMPARNFLTGVYFPQRTDIFVNQMRAAGLFPNTVAPHFLINSDEPGSDFINKGDTLVMTAPAGAIYFTTDGSDPAVWNPVPLPAANAILYTGKIVLNSSAIIRARCINNGEWSASVESSFIIKSDYNKLKITEINYHPAMNATLDEGELEFLEIKNTGTSVLDLEGCIFSGGIDYRYYNSVPSGEYDGQLDNSGERIIMLSPLGDTIISMTYGDSSGWPVNADGDGKTIVTVSINPADQTGDPEEWRSSYHSGGSPGMDDILQISRLENVTESDYFSLYQNFPNPFIERTAIPYSIKEDADAELSVFDRYGHRIRIIDNNFMPAGEYLAEWDGLSDNGSVVPAGVYLYRLTITMNGIPRSLTRTLIKTR